MGLLTETVYGFKAIAPLPRGGGAAWTWSPRSSLLFARGLPGEREYRSAIGDGSNNSICEATIMWIARNFPEGEATVARTNPEDDIAELLRSHPLSRKLRRPNYVFGDRSPGYSGVLLWMGTMVSWNIDGNAYWLKRRTPSGALRELWYIPHFMIEPRGSVTDAGTYVDHYDYRSPYGDVVPLDPSEVFHMRYGIDPDNPLKGRSPLRTAYRELFTDEKGAQTTAALLANLGVPGLVISPTKDAKTRPTEDEKTAIKARYQQSWSGDRIGEPIVMSSPTEVSQFGFNPEQLSLASLRDIPEERVTSLLGVPAAVVGFGTGIESTKTNATMVELRAQAFENCLIPTHRLAGGELDIQILPEFCKTEEEYEQHAVVFDLSRSTALLDSLQKRATIHATMARASLERRDEARGAMGLRTKPVDAVFVGSPGVVPTTSTGGPPAGAIQPPAAPPALPPGEVVQKAIAAGMAEIRSEVRALRDDRARQHDVAIVQTLAAVTKSVNERPVGDQEGKLLAVVGEHLAANVATLLADHTAQSATQLAAIVDGLKAIRERSVQGENAQLAAMQALTRELSKKREPIQIQLPRPQKVRVVYDRDTGRVDHTEPIEEAS